MRTRQEIRSLSAEQWNRVVRALWIMKTTPVEEGQRKYGNSYVSYDAMISKHSLAALDPSGDSAHFGPHFFLFHRCWLMQIENSLLLIDNKIDGLPYWDYRIDMSEGFSQDSPQSAFSDAYLGKMAGKKPRFVVTNGRFRYWPITKVPGGRVDGAAVFPLNRYGYLRHPLSINNSPFLTRNAFTVCGNYLSFDDHSAWNDCLANPSNVEDYFFCVDRRIHAPPHLVGGSWRRRKQQSTSTCSQWFGFIAPPSPLQPTGAYVHPYAKGCFECSDMCEQDDPPEKCMCVPRHANNSCGPLFTGLLNQSSSSSYAQIRLACEDDIQVTGDMLDAVASPNDPLFIFHHTNVDRHFTLWTARMDSLRINTTLAAESYYSFPTDSACNGCNLADVISAVSPFMRSIFEPYEEKTILQTPTVSAASLRRRREVSTDGFSAASSLSQQDDDYYVQMPNDNDDVSPDNPNLTIKDVFDLTARSNGYYQYTPSSYSPSSPLANRSFIRRNNALSPKVSMQLRDPMVHRPIRISINSHSTQSQRESMEFIGFARGAAIIILLFTCVSAISLCACIFGALVQYVNFRIRTKNVICAAPDAGAAVAMQGIDQGQELPVPN